MAYSEELADRIREEMQDIRKLEEKKMFGGVCFMVNDKMCVGVSKDHLMVRFDPELQETVMNRKGAKPMEFTKKVMHGFAFVDPDSINNTKDLRYWIDLALEFNPKAKASKKKTPKK